MEFHIQVHHQHDEVWINMDVLMHPPPNIFFLDQIVTLNLTNQMHDQMLVVLVLLNMLDILLTMVLYLLLFVSP